MSIRLEQLSAAGLLSPLDLHFALTVAKMVGENRDEVLLAAALVSRNTGAGHVCLDLRSLDRRWVAGALGEEPLSLLDLPERESWLTKLRSSALVGSGDRPLVLDEAGRLYLERYWRYEESVARELTRRATEEQDLPPSTALTENLDRLFPPTSGPGLHPARAAAEGVLRRRLTVISGGPGTGKTSTVLKLLALLVEMQQRSGGRRLRTTLLAPTGKAAARLADSIRERKASLPCSDAVKETISETTSTIHRALGWRRSQPTRFIHDEANPLATDVVVVDEASMVDLALLAKLLAAIPKQAGLILLGDEDQLSSVEVGAILGDICNRAARARSTEAPIAHCVFRLEESHRFGAESGIGALARAIQAGDATGAMEILRDPARPDVRLEETRGSRGLPRGLFEEASGHYRPYLEAETPEARAKAFGRYRILCAHAIGPGGVITSNLEIERRLAQAGHLALEGSSYHRRPIMISENDYGLELYNGDVGFIVQEASGELRAQFVLADGGVRSLSPARLPKHETVFAMTIHKSQGSEMDHVSIVLPDHLSPVLSRELLYTAVTRARVGVTIYAQPELIAAAIEHRIQRASGLTDRLWGPVS